MHKIKLIVTDVDGVWTDGGVYYSSNGEALKKFNFRDGGGVVLANYAKIPVIILSGENSESVSMRMKKLNIKEVHLGIRNKFNYLSELCLTKSLSLSEVAYIGDDINDLKLIQECGYTSCPNDASRTIKQNCSNILKSKGGEGAFREFVENILIELNMLDIALDLYYKDKT
jgi:3-deoxy-D-glycero-D-galacto-nononate 9-phosphatase